MPKIVHLTSVHPAFDIRIFQKECKSLARAGYDVRLVVPHTQDESKDGVQIMGVPKSKNRLERMALTSWRVFRAALQQRANLYHFHDAELILVGILLKLLGKKVIYDVHEDLPRQMLSKWWIAKWLRGSVAVTAEFTERLAARVFDGIVTVTPTIAARFPTQKTVLVRNFPIRDELVTLTPSPYEMRKNIVAYVGGIAVIRGINEMIDALALLPEGLTTKLILAGTFRPETLEQEVSLKAGWECVESRGWQSREQIAHLLSEARVGLVTLHPIINYVDALPIKLFEYMAAGLPVVASDFPLWREIVEKAKCGLLVDPLKPQAIADAILWLLTHPNEAKAMGENGRQAVEGYYNWEVEAKKLLEFYAKILQ